MMALMDSSPYAVAIPPKYGKMNVEEFYSYASHHSCKCPDRNFAPVEPLPPEAFTSSYMPWPPGAKAAWQDGLTLPCPVCGFTLSSEVIRKCMAKVI